jgi:hypothetical protein
MGLNEERQKALIKRAVLDRGSIVAEHNTPQGTQVVSRYAFRGVTLEVFAMMAKGRIEVQGARVIQA